MRLILASASPTRAEILRRAGVRAEVIVSGVDESGAHTGTVAEEALVLAAAKADAVAGRPGLAPALVLGCDSLLDIDGAGYGKPADEADVRRRWAMMSGRTGVLHTGHCLIRLDEDGRRHRGLEVASTVVHFGRPSAAELNAYARSGEPTRVAGAFTLDGLGGWFVESIEGDHGTVLGLSLPLLRRMLAASGAAAVDLWDSYASRADRARGAG